MKLIKRLTISPSIMKATLSLSIPLLLVSAGNYVAFSEQVATTILLDVNPSIEMTVNKIDEVIEVKALNEDAETVIEDMDFEGVDVDVAMHVIVGSMVRNGYIDEAKNAVLVTVENEDNAKQQELERVVTSEINDRMVVADIAPIIFTQDAVKKVDNASVKAFAKEHDISLNKAAFIQKILKENKELSEEELVAMNVESLSEVIRAKNIDLYDSGAYSDKTLTKTSEKTVKKAAKATDKQTAVAGKETKKKAKVSPATEFQVTASEKQVAAATQSTEMQAEVSFKAEEPQTQVVNIQAVPNTQAADRQAEAQASAAEAQIQAAEKQAEAAAKAAEQQAKTEAKAKEEQIQAAEKQAEAAAKEAEKQAEAEAKAAEKQENGNGKSAESDN